MRRNFSLILTLVLLLTVVASPDAVAADPVCTITGTAGDDVLVGTGQDDVICGLGGVDTVTAGNGNDLVYGGAGNDILYGENGDDTIYGEGGADQVDGGSGVDALFGGDGNDALIGANGDDAVTGEAGNDQITGGNGADDLLGAAGTDTVDGGPGSDRCAGETLTTCETVVPDSGPVDPSAIAVAAPNASEVLFGETSVVASVSPSGAAGTVDFSVDGILVAATAIDSGLASFTWDTGLVADGSHTISLLARNSAGATGPSASLTVEVANALTGPERVTKDFEGGRIVADEYAELGLWSLFNVEQLPARYQSDNEFGEEATGQALEFLSVWEQLQGATQDRIEDFLTLVENGPTGAAAPGVWAAPKGLGWMLQVDPYWSSCSGFHIVVLKIFPCSRTVFDGDVTARFRIYYQVGSGKDAVPSNPAVDDDGGVGGVANNHVPDAVDAVAASLLQSLERFTSSTELSYRAPADLIHVVLHRTRGAALPVGNRVVQLSNTATFSYLPRHELFHRIQYEYVSLADFRRVGTKRLNWWQEATAEWAAHQVDAPREATIYAAAADAFLSRPDRLLVAWDGFGEPRQYGAFLLPAYLEERFPDLVVRSWELIDAGSTPLEAIDLQLVVEGSSWKEELPVFWRANYQLTSWDPPEPYTDLHANTVWRNDLDARLIAPQTSGDQDESFVGAARFALLGLGAARPYHHQTRLEPGVAVSDTVTVSEGGAWYVDLVPLAEGEGTIDLDVDIAPTEAGSFNVAAEVLSFSTYPDLCTAPQAVPLTASGASLEGSISIPVFESCRFATLVLTNANPFSSQSQARLTWSATFTEAPAANLGFELGTLQNWSAVPIAPTTSFEVRADGHPEATDPYAAHILLGGAGTTPEQITRVVPREGTEAQVVVAGTAGAVATLEVSGDFGTRQASITLTGPNDWQTIFVFITGTEELTIRLIGQRGTAPSSADIAFDGFSFGSGG